MTLSAQDVHDKQFKLVRNSTGYDMDEVDAFLDEVEAAVQELTDRLAAADEHGAEAGSGAQGAQAASGAEPGAASGAQDTPSSAEDVASAAAGILAMAQRTADEYVAEARRRAEEILSDAQRAATDSVQGLEQERQRLEDRVKALRTFESEVRTRLTGFFQSQLTDLKSLTDQA